MKTLREYIDRLDEISRRDFLKTAGTAVAGAALGKLPAAQAKSSSSVARYAADLAVKTVLGRLHQQTGYDLRNYISENIYKFVSIACGMGRCPDRELIDRVNRLAAEESGIKDLNFVTGMLANMKDLTKDFVLAYANHLSDELDNVSSRSSNTPSSISRQPETPQSKDRESDVQRSTQTIKQGFESGMIDTGLVLYVYASKLNHESKAAIKAALNRYAQRTGTADAINLRLKQIEKDPSKFGPSTRPDQYFQQVNQIIRNIDELGAR